MQTFNKLFLIIVALLGISGCERKIGTMIKEENIEYHGITIKSRLYPIRWYGAERKVIYWCKSKQTLTFQPEFENELIENGWLSFSALGAGSMNHSDKVLKRLPNERIHIVDKDFAYIDLGEMRFSVTFDGCASVITMYINSLYDETLNIKTKPFKASELSLTHDFDFEGLTPPFFIGHTYQSIKGTYQYCFNINPVWIADKNNQYQVCTEDKGKSWFTTRKIGDEKVMKRLAGSEEWVAHE